MCMTSWRHPFHIHIYYFFSILFLLILILSLPFPPNCQLFAYSETPAWWILQSNPAQSFFTTSTNITPYTVLFHHIVNHVIRYHCYQSWYYILFQRILFLLILQSLNLKMVFIYWDQRTTSLLYAGQQHSKVSYLHAFSFCNMSFYCSLYTHRFRPLFQMR